jgi:hypothetical protein
MADAPHLSPHVKGGGGEKVRRSSAGERPGNEVERLTLFCAGSSFVLVRKLRNLGTKKPHGSLEKPNSGCEIQYPLAPAAARDDQENGKS